MWETFLLQMNDFDQILELNLRHLLDPVVASRPPGRKAGKRPQQPILTLEGAGIELAADAISVIEPVVVTLRIPAL